MIKAILACDLKGGISLNGVMPWPKNTEDLMYFKNMTKNSTVVMGRKTWEAKDMPSPLPNRKNIVVSSSNIEGADMVVDIDQLKKNIPILAKDGDIWIIGGATLLHECLGIIDEIHLTQFSKDYGCDTYINLDLIYDLFKLERYEKINLNYPDYRLVFMKKKNDQ